MKKLAILTLLCCIALTQAAAQSENTNVLSRRETIRDSILHLITGAQMPEKAKVSILKYGAKADGKRDCKPAFDKAMKAARRNGGAHVVVPAGIYYICGSIHLESNVCLELEEGAVLKFAPEPHYYLPMVTTSWEGTFIHNYSPFIYGYGLHDVSIIGKGKIDGNAMTTFATWRAKQGESKKLSREMNHSEMSMAERRFGEGHFLRPQLIQLFNCRNITLEGVEITNSPFWCIHLLKSENVICRGLRYDAKLVNNDGIDPEYARNVLIEDVHFNNGDDNVAIKCGRDNDGRNDGTSTEGIIIRRCHFKGLHAVVIGSEMSAGVRNVFVEDCDYAGYCKRGIYVKTNPDRGGFVENIFVNNCTFDEVEDLLYITSMYAGEGMDSRHFTDIRHIYVDGLKCRKVRKAALVLQGTEEKPIRNVSLSNIEVGEMTTGISFDHAEQITISNCHLGPQAGVPSTASAKDKVFEKK